MNHIAPRLYPQKPRRTGAGIESQRTAWLPMIAKAFLLFPLAIVCLVPSARSQEPVFEILFLDGRIEKTTQVQVNASRIGYASAKGLAEVDAKDLLSIRATQKQRAIPQQVLRTIDGSEIAVREVTGKNDLWSLSTEYGKVDLGKGQAAWLRFRPLQGNEPNLWKDYLESKSDSDTLVISRGEGNLDRAQGMILELSPSVVKFDFDGQALEAPIAKLLGVIWLRNSNQRVEPSVRVDLADGSRWQASDVRWNSTSASLQLKTLAGTTNEFASDSLVELDFSIANLKWLSLSSPIAAQAASRPLGKQSFAARETAFKPKFVFRRENAGPHEADLLFTTPGEITFRVPTAVSKFSSQIVRATTGDVRSELSIEVWENDQLLQEKRLGVDDDEVSILCEVHPEKRLRLVTKSSSTLMVGSEVKWLQPRFLR